LNVSDHSKEYNEHYWHCIIDRSNRQVAVLSRKQKEGYRNMCSAVWKFITFFTLHYMFLPSQVSKKSVGKPLKNWSSFMQEDIDRKKFQCHRYCTDKEIHSLTHSQYLKAMWQSSCWNNCTPFLRNCKKHGPLLTPWSTILLEKLTILQLVKKFPTFYGTWRFISAFTSPRHLSLSRANSIQFITPHSIFWRCILILASYQRLGLTSSLFPHQGPYSYECHSRLLYSVCYRQQGSSGLRHSARAVRR
jgi:hypothetical protein